VIVFSKIQSSVVHPVNVGQAEPVVWVMVTQVSVVVIVEIVVGVGEVVGHEARLVS
jgi:hypothetical protein